MIAPEKQTVRIAVERRKRGKVVTLFRGFADDPAQLSQILSTLKSKCGGGGTMKERVLEIQGDHADRGREILLQLGYRVLPLVAFIAWLACVAAPLAAQSDPTW